MNIEINIAEILEHCPKGTPLYSPICGECELDYVFRNIIVVKLKTSMFDSQFEEENFMTFDSKGRYGGDNRNYNIERECLLFPSKENRDWSQFITEDNGQTKKIKFKPFDKVLVRNEYIEVWIPRFFAYYVGTCAVCMDGNDYRFCIPYNEDTKQLIGEIKDYE